MSSNKPVITVKEARRLLGKDAKGLTDLQVINTINNLTAFARARLKKKRVKKKSNTVGLSDEQSKS